MIKKWLSWEITILTISKIYQGIGLKLLENLTYIFYMSVKSHPITGFKDDSAYVTTKTADRNQRSTKDG